MSLRLQGKTNISSQAPLWNMWKMSVYEATLCPQNEPLCALDEEGNSELSQLDLWQASDEKCDQWLWSLSSFLLALIPSNAWAEKYVCVTKPHPLTPVHSDPVVHQGRMRRNMLNGSGFCPMGHTRTVFFICRGPSHHMTRNQQTNSPQQSYYSVIANLLGNHCGSPEA